MQYKPEQVASLQRGVRGVLVFGIVTSVAANVTNTFVRPAAATTAFWLLIGAAALHALAPVVLFACTEMVSRIPIHSKLLGVVRLLVTLTVGSFAAWVSYWNMEELAGIFDPGSTSRFFYPLIIDGMMIVATISLIELGRLAHTVGEIVSAEEAEALAVAEAEEAAAIAAAQATAPARWVTTQAEKDWRRTSGWHKLPTAQAKAAATAKYRNRIRAQQAKAEQLAASGASA